MQKTDEGRMPYTLDDLVDRVTDIRQKYGNLEIRIYEKRYVDVYDEECIPHIAVIPKPSGKGQIAVVV